MLKELSLLEEKLCCSNISLHFHFFADCTVAEGVQSCDYRCYYSLWRNAEQSNEKFNLYIVANGKNCI